MLRTRGKLLIPLGLVLVGVVAVVGVQACFGPRSDADLSQLINASSIHIEDDWTGLSFLAPLEAHYDLTRQGNVFIGKAHFSVARYQRARTADEDISIPIEVVQDFLEMLSQSPAVYGNYAPRIEWTDDYPSLVIEISMETETISFHSKSQGEGHVPWGLDQKGHMYIINSNQPAKALAILEPYFKKDVLDRLKNQPQMDSDTFQP
jgi:hypothetical protein